MTISLRLQVTSGGLEDSHYKRGEPRKSLVVSALAKLKLRLLDCLLKRHNSDLGWRHSCLELVVVRRNLKNHNQVENGPH